MEAIGLALSAAQTLFSALQSSQVKEICSALGYKSELENLHNTINIVKAVLKDAEAKQELSSHEADVWIGQLKEAVYDADDLLDEFLTLAERKQLLNKGTGKVSKKVCVHVFFSRFNQLHVAYDMSKEVKKIRKRLNAIADDHSKFGFRIDNQPIRRRREETCSYVYANDIIGREEDTEKIVGLLLDSNLEHDVSFLTIVGMGGLGKTTLAQLVYNNENIKQEFGLRLWACVSDQDPDRLDVKMVLDKILESATGQKPDGSSMDKVQAQLRQHLGGKKYLLVLDDVWIEARDEWRKLVGFLMGGMRGSWIMVTTRSRKTARVVGNGLDYELQGLSDKDSWSLFEMTAFEPGQGQAIALDLVGIGKEVVKKCRNVPLAIRVLGSLLYGQDKSKWLSFRDIGFAGIRLGENGVLSILKLSYHNLESPLKSCFSFCAFFPKDFLICKETLISLWMAHGYIVPLDECQGIEDAAEEYFSILFKRCFFQDVEKDEFGEIVKFKIHDLMHDIAQEVVGNEICIADSIPTNLGERIRHLSIPRQKCIEKFCPKIRTYFSFGKVCNFFDSESKCLSQLLENWKCLRALELRNCLNEKDLPISIGELVHLRYLDLSCNSQLEALPKSFTKLHNLQTLYLTGCGSLKELPKDLGKLVNLRSLGLKYCEKLKRMPLGLGKLTSLNWLNVFAVDSSCKLSVVDQLENLAALTNLRGHLRIPIYGVGDVEETRKGGECLSSKERLNSIDAVWEKEENDGQAEYQEMLMECLQPHPNLKRLGLWYYRGERMARWAREDNLATFLPNLVEIMFCNCKRVRYLPSLGKLRHLKSLVIRELSELEYMEETSVSVSVSGGAAAKSESSSLFPSLERLELNHLSKLKGWWRGGGGGGVGAGDNIRGSGGNNRQPPPSPAPPRRCLWPSFPCLYQLRINDCDNLTSVPLCSSLESLILGDLSKLDEIVAVSKGGGEGVGAAAASLFKLRVFKVGNVDHLDLLPKEVFRNLTDIII